MEQSWEIENIPDEDVVYMRLHRSMIDPEGNLNPGLIRLRPGEHGMSVDWNKYSTPEETRNRAKVPADNGVVSFPVGGVRKIPFQEVLHAPIPQNQAHAEIIGDKKDPEIRLRFMQICTIILSVSS
jgi:hypothetical protein